jgi:hypothetical protein
MMPIGPMSEPTYNMPDLGLTLPTIVSVSAFFLYHKYFNN